MRTYIHTIRRTLLTLCLMATATLAWADDEVEVSTVDELKTAIAEKGTGTTFKLTTNLILSETIELNADRNFTLDLAGHEIEGLNCRAIWIKQGGLTITSSEDNGKITSVGQIDSNSSVIRVGHNDTNNGTASLDIKQGVTIETDVCYGVTVFGKNNDGESLTVDGTIKTKISPAISGNGSSGLASTTITVGEKANIKTTNNVAIYHPQAGTLTVNGTVTGAGGIEMKGGQLVVGSTAKITANGTLSHTANNNDPSTRGYAIAIVENGQYAGVSVVNISSQAAISGPVAMVKDSDNDATTPDFTGSDVKMLVKVTDAQSNVLGQYLSLELAMQEAAEGSTIQLLGDCAITSTIETSKDYTLDLNGNKLTSDGQRALWIQSGDVTIKSTTTGGRITVPTVSNKDLSVIRVGSNVSTAVSLKVEQGVTIYADECYGITIFGMNETQVLNVEGNVETKIRPAISGHGTKTLKPTDITIASTATITTTDNVAIYHPQGGTITVDGTVTGAGGIEIKGGTLVVGSTAEITATGTPTHVTKNDDPSTSGYAIAIVENNAGYGNGNGVSAVTINSSAKIVGIVAKLQDSSVTDYKLTIKDESGKTLAPVASIGEDKYFTLKDAVDIVPSQGTVKLLAYLTLTETTVMDKEKTYTLDLAGHTLSGNRCTPIQVASGNVTISNTGTEKKTITTDAAAPAAAILLGSDTGNNRNTTLTIGEKVCVDGGSAAGILLQGTATRETLNVQGQVSATGHSAIVTGDEIGKIEIAPGATVTASNAVAIYQTKDGELVVSGTVEGTGTTAGAIEMKGGNLTVNSGATITAVGTATHKDKNDAPFTNGYAIAIVENENFPGVGKAYIDKGADITGVIVYLIDSKNNNVAEPMFTGDYTLVAETNIKDNGYGDKYVKLSDAIAAANGEVRLLDDLTENITITSPITLDLGDYTLINNNAEAPAKPSIIIDVNTEGTVKLKNGGVISGKTGEPATTMSNSGIVVTKGTVELQNIGVNTGGVSLTVNGGTVTTDNKSTFTSTGDHTIALGGGTLTVAGKVQNSSDSYAAIEATAGNLTVATTATISSENGNGIDWQSSYNLTIEGGKISGTQAVYANDGKVTINGGTFTGKVDGVYFGTDCNAPDKSPEINHGTFICGTGVPIKAATATGFVQGDYFSKEIAQNLCAPGYKVSDTPKNNGMFYLVDKVVIYDGKDWDFPKDSYTIKTATYERNSGMGTAGTKFGTLCLPFSFYTNDDTKTTIPEGMKFYKVTSINADKNVITITPLTGEINAGTPVIFQLSQAATKFTIESHNAEIPEEISSTKEYNLVGTLSKITLDDSGNSQDMVSKVYYLNSDAFHQASEKVDVPAFRAYIKFSSPSGAKVLYIQTEDEEADAIAPTPLDDEMEAVYDLNGRKQNGLQRGMNIMKMKNGRTIKVFVNK